MGFFGGACLWVFEADMGVRVYTSVGGLDGLVVGLAGLVAGLTGLVVVVPSLLVRLVDRATVVTTTGLVGAAVLVGGAAPTVSAATSSLACILEFFQLVVECQIDTFGYLIVGIVHDLRDVVEQSVHVEVEVVGVEVVGWGCWLRFGEL